MAASHSVSAGRQAGSQTLDRGLTALELVVAARGGMTIQEVADALGVHRTIASRVLTTIAEHRLIARGADGRFRAAGGLAALARHLHGAMREQALPVLRTLADELGASIALCVEDGDEAVALAVAEPSAAQYWISFREGSRHPLDRGAAGYALLAALPPREGEDARVTEGRRTGYVVTFGEVESGYWGLGVPLDRRDGEPAACLLVISATEALARDAAPMVTRVAGQLGAAFTATP